MFNEFEKIDPEKKNGYIVASKDPNIYKCRAADYGTPQKRERLFVVGCNSKYGSNPFIYPDKTHGPGKKYPYITVDDAFRYLPTIKSGEGADELSYLLDYENDYKNGKISEAVYKYFDFISGKTYCEKKYFSKDVITYQKALNHRKNMIERFENIKQGEGMQSAAKRLIAEGKEEIVERSFPNKLYASRNRRLRSGAPSFTVTSHCLDEMIHPTENRQLTPREAARLQGFPDWYSFEGPYVKFHSDPEQDKYEQIGDAIPVLMAKALAQSFTKALKKLKDSE